MARLYQQEKPGCVGSIGVKHEYDTRTRLGGCSDDAQEAGAGCERNGAVFCLEKSVFDSDAAEAFDVNSRFDGEDHSGNEFLFSAGSEPGALVDFESYAVAKPVCEVLF